MFIRLGLIVSAFAVLGFYAGLVFPVSAGDLALEPSRAISGPGTPPSSAGKLQGPPNRRNRALKRSPGVRPGKILPIPLDLTDQRRWVVRS
jgi:hypothetical protein